MEACHFLSYPVSMDSAISLLSPALMDLLASALIPPPQILLNESIWPSEVGLS
jgi:hypothetical protein